MHIPERSTSEQGETGIESGIRSLSFRSPHRCRLVPAAFLFLFLLMPAVLFGQGEPAAPRAFPFAHAVGLIMKGIRVETKECPWCTDEIKNLALDLMNLHENEPFTEEAYRQSMEALELSMRFEEIACTIEPVEGGIMLVFGMKPTWEIKDIRIQGDYPLFKSEVLKTMSVYPGDTFLPGMPAGQEALITALYRSEGFINPAATVTSEKNPRDGTVILDVNIESGPYYVLDPLKIRGNDSIPDAEIKSRMNVWRYSFFIRESGRFRQSDLNGDLKNLTSLYWQRGFVECEIHHTIKKDEKSQKAEVVVSISEGPRYEVSITGNKRFWAYTLKKDITVFKEGNRRDRGIKKSIENIKKRYRMEGYPFTEVEVLGEKITTKNKTTRRIEFSIIEGPQVLVDFVRFTGNLAMGEERLKRDMQTGKEAFFRKNIYIPEVLDEDLAAIKALYIEGGYTEVKISPTLTWNKDRTAVGVTIAIFEGLRTLVSSVRVDGLKALTEKKVFQALQLKEGESFRNHLIKSDETALSDLISEKGHPYVTVRAETIFHEDRSKVDLIYHVDEGPYVTMGNIYYRGNFKTRKSAINRELGINPGESFSLKTMLNGQKNIRDMEIFDSVQLKTIGIKEKRDRITLLMDMEEIRPYYLQAGAGYASDIGLYGKAKAGDRNLFGLNKDAWLSGQVSQTGYNSELGVTQRRIFGTPISSTYALSYERKEEFNQTFGTSVWTSSLSFLREFKPKHLTTSLGFRYELRDEFLTANATPENVDTYDPRGLLVTTPFVSYDTRDSFVRPTEGTYSSLSVDISKGIQNSFDNFLKYYLNLRYYLSPTQRLTLAWLGRLGYIDPFGTVSTIPEDQLFYLGGTLSVRGFDENMLRYDENKDPVGGRMAIVGSMEARFEINPDWEATLFYDTGSVRDALIDAGADGFRSSVGIGMRYITPIGPIGLLYGQKIAPRKGESAGKYHFSLGYTF